jgi:BirA family biotin operon repressor/biotin-[acetyl-CoA-carboxylase] ligase
LAATLSTTPTLNIPLLQRLRCGRGNYLPICDLGGRVEEVHHDLDALVAAGFQIERHPYWGAAYRGPAPSLCPDQIGHELGTRWIGRRIAVWSRVASTNDLAARAGASAANDGLVVLAEEQTAGRGRLGRSWASPPRSSILMSVLLFPPPQLAGAGPESAFGCAWLTALGAIATAEVVATATGRQPTIKWPNDVRVAGRKIAGILVERPLASRTPIAPTESAAPALTPRSVVIGIGLNCNVEQGDFLDDLQSTATSIQIERGGEPVDRSELCRDLIRRLDHWYDLSRNLSPQVLSAPWSAMSEHLGQVVRLATADGTVTGRLTEMDLLLGLTLDVDATSAASRGPRTEVCKVTVPPADILTLEA